jgi:flagellar FliL protein
MSAKPAKPAEAAAEGAAPPKSKKKLFIIIGAVVVLLGGGGAAAWFMTKGGDHGAKHEEVEPPKAPVYLPLETFTVNLQGGEQYLQTDITLQVGDEAELEAFKANMPRVRSRLLALLGSKNAEELVTAEDKKKLVQEILVQVKQPFAPKGKPQKVDDVLFTTFVIQ